MRATSIAIVLACSGCSLLITDTSFRSDASTPVDSGPRDAGRDAGRDAEPADGETPDAGGIALRCGSMVTPTTLCMASPRPATRIVLPTRAIRPRLALSVVERGAGVAAASGLMSESGASAWVVYNELGAVEVGAVPDAVVDLPPLVRSFLGPPQPDGVRSLAIRRVAPGTLGLTFLTNDPDMAPGGRSEAWGATLTGTVLADASNYTGSTFLQFGEAAMTGGQGIGGARHFWRETASTVEPMTLVSMPHGGVGGANWRSTQIDVDDAAEARRVVGTDGSFIATTSEIPSRLQLWTGLGASASMPTFVNAATPAIPYDFDPAHTLVSFDLAWVSGERYVVGLILDDSTSLFARLVPADCSVDCLGDPEVCSTNCTFGTPLDLPLAGATDARIALTGAGPGFAAAIAQNRGGAWEVGLTIRHPASLTILNDGEGAPLVFALDSAPISLEDLVASSLTRTNDLDLAIGVLGADAAGKTLDLVSVRACLCR